MSSRMTIPGAFGGIMMVLFDLVYVAVTPCSLKLPTDFHAGPWTFGGCSYEMRMTGIFLTVVVALIGFGLGWMFKTVVIGHH